MFNENLKAVRKEKGYTQEELAIKLNVVRQTVSKWEKGLSVPDADVLSQIADVLDTNVSVLLGGKITEDTNKDAIAEQLAIKNKHNKTIWKVIGIILLIIVIFNVLAVTVFSAVGTKEYTEESSLKKVELDEN